MAEKGKARTTAKQKNVVSCNFRSAGRISNEHARALTSIHEKFARNLASVLDSFLGTGVEVKIDSLDQLRFEEHVAAIPAFCCVAPFAMKPAGAVLVECGVELAFAVIDLLLGGEGSSVDGPRELSEIEEEIMLDVFSLIARQAEAVWGLPAGALIAGRPVKAAVLDQSIPKTDKVTCIRFTLQIGEIAGTFQLVLPTALLSLLLQSVRTDQPQKRATLRYFPRQGIRDRILDSDVEVSVELPGLKIAVKDLVGLLPGSVLKLRASVRTPGMLTAGGHGIFEATPVRNGSRKAAQLGRRLASPNLERV